MTAMFRPIAFLILGLVLMIIEVLVPSAGLVGVLSIVCLGVSLWHAFAYSTALGFVFVMIELATAPLTAMAAVWLWSRSSMSRKMTLAPPSPDEIDVSHSETDLRQVVGEQGRALTPLRPSGHVEIDGRRFDGLAEEGLIPEGSPVHVVKARSGQLVVRASRAPLEPDPLRTAASATAAESSASYFEDSP